MNEENQTINPMDEPEMQPQHVASEGGDDHTHEHCHHTHEVPPSSGRTTKIALLISLLALAGVIVLFLTGRTGVETAGTKPQPIINSEGEVLTGTRIAFVRADSVQNNYLMTIHFLDSIERRFRSMENDLMGKKGDLEKKVNNYYRDVQSGLLKETAALQIKERIEAEGEKIAQLEENYTTRINDLQLQLNIIYFDSLWSFIERHKGEFGVDMVVGYQQGLTNIFFADATLDLTDQIIQLMNDEYAIKFPDRKNLKKKTK
jgi:outer membrane protein